MQKPFEAIGGQIIFDVGFHAKLRKLRLWHWQQAMACRKAANQWADFIDDGFGDPGANAMRCDELNARANQHIIHVQTLNEFFMTTDTAENDDNG